MGKLDEELNSDLDGARRGRYTRRLDNEAIKRANSCTIRLIPAADNADLCTFVIAGPSPGHLIQYGKRAAVRVAELWRTGVRQR